MYKLSEMEVCIYSTQISIQMGGASWGVINSTSEKNKTNKIMLLLCSREPTSKPSKPEPGGVRTWTLQGEVGNALLVSSPAPLPQFHPGGSQVTGC